MKHFSVQDWKFYLGEEKNAWQKDFNDDVWEAVTVPHDWSVRQNFVREASSGTGYLPGGIGWYRGRISLDEIKSFHTTRLIFEGVYKNAQVWVNGYHVGSRPSGYATFSFDISEFIQYNLDNQLIISVRVDHTDLADSRWYNGSGITRPVTIECHDTLQIAEYGSFFETKSITGNLATIAVSHNLINQSDKTIEAEIIEEFHSLKTGIVKIFKKAVSLKANEHKTIFFEEQLENADLWSDETPNLYALKTSLVNQETKEISFYEETVGIRVFEFSPSGGFSINGMNKKLKGVCLHEDAGPFGTAVPSSVWMRRLLKLKEMGTNAIRMAHNPHSKNLYRLCDLLGFYVIDEAFDEWDNPKNKWWQGHNVYPPKHEGYAEHFPNWHQADLENMIDTNKNHASIIAWSIGNEIDYPNDPYANPLFSEMTGNNDASKPAAERAYNPNRPDTRRLSTIAKNLIDIAKAKDTTRPITLAAAFPELSSHTGLLDDIDLIGYNYKEHLYEEDHQRFPNHPFIGSENGHGYEQWLAVKNNDYIGGQFLWTGIDYLGEAHGWPIHGSGAGLLTLAGFEKNNFNLRKSWWSEEPTIHLVTRLVDENHDNYYPFYRKWDYAKGTPVEVYCFSNCESVTLRSEEQEWLMDYDQEKGYFKAVIPATLDSLVAAGKKGTEEISDEIVASSAGCQLATELWAIPNKLQEAAELAQVPIEKGLYQIECTLLDRLGNLAANDIHVTVKVENGELLGIENGDLGDVTSYLENYRSTFNGKLIIFVKGNNQTEINISGEGIAQQSIKISSYDLLD